MENVHFLELETSFPDSQMLLLPLSFLSHLAATSGGWAPVEAPLWLLLAPHLQAQPWPDLRGTGQGAVPRPVNSMRGFLSACGSLWAIRQPFSPVHHPSDAGVLAAVMSQPSFTVPTLALWISVVFLARFQGQGGPLSSPELGQTLTLQTKEVGPTQK